MKRKRLRDFIKENREYLDTIIWREMGFVPYVTPDEVPQLDDKEREKWIFKNEVLYRLARSSGVRIGFFKQRSSSLF